jgi:endonuclease/exonuclease/phosphatase family metal-dependent hydrolase
MSQIKIATFNSKNFSITNQDKTTAIANTIKASGADIIAIQEISNLGVITELLKYLPDNFGILHHEEQLDNSKIHEYMIFIYNNNIIKAIKCMTFTKKDREEFIGSTNKMMMRAPVYARFIINNSTDLVIISYHTNAKSPMNDCIRIKDNIKAIRKNNMCNNIVILGDFNTSCDDKYSFGKLLKRGWLPSLPSHIKTNFNGEKQYDNIWYHPDSCKLIEPAKVLRECIPEGTTIDNYSDHCMVTCKLKIIKRLSSNAEIFNPPDMMAAIHDKNNPNLFRFIRIPCFGNTNIICDCKTIQD